MANARKHWKCSCVPCSDPPASVSQPARQAVRLPICWYREVLLEFSVAGSQIHSCALITVGLSRLSQLTQPSLPLPSHGSQLHPSSSIPLLLSIFLIFLSSPNYMLFCQPFRLLLFLQSRPSTVSKSFLPLCHPPSVMKCIFILICRDLSCLLPLLLSPSMRWGWARV